MAHSRLQPRTAMNMAQHKIIHLLKTLWDCFVITCHNVSLNERADALTICTHARLQFYGGVRLPVCYLPRADSRIDTIRCYMCLWWLSEAAIINNISTSHCNVRHLMLFRSRVSILTWLLKVPPVLGSTSCFPCHTLQLASRLTLHQQPRGPWKGPNLAFYFPVNYFS